MSMQGKELYEFGPFRLDSGRRVLLRENQPVPLQLKAFDTLLVLVRSGGQVVLKDELMKAVWPDTFVEEANLAQNIFVLRKALGAVGGDRRYIVTHPGRGYSFVEDVRVVADEEDSLVVESHSRSRVIIQESQPVWTWAPLAAGAVILVALGVGAGWRQHQPEMKTPVSAPPAAAVKARRSVAVLGFENLSGKSDPAWLSTAFSEMLTTELAAGDQLRLVSAEEVEHLKASRAIGGGGTLSKATLAGIRETLGADIVVLGAYSDLGKHSGGQIRLDLRLQDTSAGETVATISETGTETELFQLVSRAGAHLREKVSVPAISGEQASALQAALPSNVEAARLYAKGLERLRRFDALDARNYLEQAVGTDAGFALAHSALAEVWSQLGYEAKAVAEAKKSLELSGQLPRKERLYIEARYDAMKKEWGKAVDLYRTLFEFFPDDIEYGLRLADAQTQAGKRAEALATIESLRRLPPPGREDPRIDLAEEMNYVRLGQYSKAREPGARAVEKTRASGFTFFLAKALWLEAASRAALGEGDKALADTEEARKIYGSVGDRWGVANTLDQDAHIHLQRGDWEMAEKLLRQALAVNREIGNKTGEAIDLTALCSSRETHGDVAGGKKLAQEALAIYREIGDRNREAWALMGVAWAVAAEDDLKISLAMDAQALAIFKEVSDDSGAAYALSEEASGFSMTGDLAKAKQAAQGEFDLAQKAGQERMIVGALFYQGNIAKLEGRLEDARKTFSDALLRVRRVGLSGLTAEYEQELAEIADEENRRDEARRQVNETLATLREHKDPTEEIGLDSLLARIALEDGDTTTANRAISEARSLLSQSEGWEEHFLFALADARVQAAGGKAAEARDSLKSLIGKTAKHGNVRYQLEAELALCEIEAESDPASARARAKTLEHEAGAKGFGFIQRKALVLEGVQHAARQ